MRSQLIKKSFYVIGVISATFTCLFGILIFFIFSSNISEFLKEALNLHVTSSFVGGNVVKTFYDAEGDDKGNGILVYPTNKNFENGALDLLSYTIHEPVYDAKWQKHSEYWQLDLKFKSSGEKTRNIMIYIGANNFDGKNTETLFDAAENISFNSEYPWTYALWIRDSKGTLYTKENEICDVQLEFLNEGKNVNVRIPIEKEELLKFYSSEVTWHYVICGAYSPWDKGGFSTIEKRKNISRGSVNSSSEHNQFIPKIFDILDDSMFIEKNQYEQLNSFDLKNYTKAIVQPHIVNMKEKENIINEYDELLEKVENLMKSENEENVISDNSKRSKALKLFKEGKSEEAKKIFKEIIIENPNDEVVLAYYGSCIAIEAGHSNVMDAVRLVNESYTYLDKAVELAEGKESEVDALMNRASVSESVPDGVFHKMEVAAKDYYKCAELSSENEVLQMYLLLKSAKAYESCGQKDNYEIIIRKVKSLIN